MKIIIQRTNSSKLFIDNKLFCETKKGFLALVGFTASDDESLFPWFANRIMNLRIFPDEEGKMNLSLLDVGGEAMFVSNFTLYGDSKKGFRPSYSGAMQPADAELLYYKFVDYINFNYKDTKVASGVFGAMMDIEFVNSGPVTLIIEKNNELKINEKEL
ncbi:MAG: D-tyrosyl-tRNA(Tyr) deacylase [Ignavibacteria bacterium GWF2_33_9]|nr:MAG: D-tyrosyl-tRNA(Tyr) deacylase [Ignavibacteria bacterium GWF2_33_9]